MDELMISGKRYISSRRAGKEYHYHSDYIGQLIRAGKIAGQKVGRSWYVSESSLAAHMRQEAAQKVITKAEKKIQATAASRQYLPEKKTEKESVAPAVEIVPKKKITDAPDLSAKKIEAEFSASPILSKQGFRPSAAEPKLLTYISDSDESSKEKKEIVPTVEDDRKKKSFTPPVEEYLRTHPAEDQPVKSAAIPPSLRIVGNTTAHTNDDEVPVKMRVTTRPEWQPPQEARIESGSYSYRDLLPARPVLLTNRKRMGVKLILAILILGVIGLVGGFLISWSAPIGVEHTAN